MTSHTPPSDIDPVLSHGNAGLSYKAAGVDIDAGEALVERIKPLAKKTRREGVLTSIGGFGGLFEISKKYREPVLVSGTDGVGTKLKLAFALNRHDTIGQDLVAMSVNDILAQGAEPLFFLDYFACGKLNVDTAATVIAGIAKGCELAGCALIGGETAEMPGLYKGAEYDLAGFAVGVVEKSRVLGGSELTEGAKSVSEERAEQVPHGVADKTLREGDVVLGLASSGAHANGYSLIRKILERAQADLQAEFLPGQSLADVLMAPTHIYVKPVLGLLELGKVKAIAHITGGGLLENIPRVLPEHLTAELDAQAWERPKLFDWLQEKGQVHADEMHRVFNCGIGLTIVVAKEEASRAMDYLTAQGERVWAIGSLRARASGEAQTIVR